MDETEKQVVLQEKELVKKINNFDPNTLKVMLFSIQDIDLLKQLVAFGEDFQCAVTK